LRCASCSHLISADIPKHDLCKQLHEINKADGPALKKIIYGLQSRRQFAHNMTLGDAVKASRTMPAKKVFTTDKAAFNNRVVSPPASDVAVCFNQSQLSRKPEDYADVDIVFVDEGDRTYCLESIDYPTWLEQGSNPITGRKLTAQAKREIEGKWKTLNDTKVPIESKGFRYAIDRIKQKQGLKDEYEDFIRIREMQFLELAESYGIDRAYFLASPEDGGLTNLELESLARDLTENQGLLFDTRNRKATLRSFTVTLLDEIEYLKELSDEDVDAMFQKMKDLIGLNEEVVAVVEDEN
ncbi:MAG: hypothetical protein ACMG6E_01820, partial [Candidatus Roizmanbacteria bacterium]